MIYRDQLEAVYRLIEKPERWVQGKYALNANALWVNEKSPDAVCWCLMGAAMKCGVFEKDSSEENADMAYALGLNPDTLVCEWNDENTHEEVLSCLKSAIERAPVRS